MFHGEDTVALSRWIACVLLALLLWPVLARGQSPELWEAYERYEELDAEGRYDEAIPFAEEASRLGEDEFGSNDPTTATLLNNLANLYYKQGRYAEAELLYRRSLAIRETALVAGHPDVAQGLNNLAALYHAQGRYAEAEPLYWRALAIQEKALYPGHPDIAQSLNNLAAIYHAQGRYAEAEPLYWRALAIDETALGPGHPEVATTLNNLAVLYKAQGRYAEAEPLYQQALAIRETALKPDHPDLAQSYNNLAELYRAQARHAEAEPLYKRALAIWEKVLGPEHPYMATSLNNLALLYIAEGRYDMAETLYGRSLATRQTAVGPNHPEVAQSLNNLAAVHEKQGRFEEALSFRRRATTIYRARASQAAGRRSASALSEQQLARSIFIGHVWLAQISAEREPERRIPLTAEAFEVAQLARATSVAGALARMAARFAAGDDELAALVRARQDALDGWRRVDEALLATVSGPPEERDEAAEAGLRAELAGIDRLLDDLDARLANDFPDYAELATPRPLALAQTQALLGPDEALIAYLVDDYETFLWVVRRTGVGIYGLEIGRKELNLKVELLRARLDPTGRETIPEFDIALAHELYETLFAPAEPALEGVNHIFIVPDAGLGSLPLGVLATEPLENDIAGYSDYRQVAWLVKRYALTVLPSVSSLKALRRFAGAASAAKPFIGFGDPVLEGSPGSGRGLEFAALFTRGAVADVEAVRDLPALPETAEELAAIAQTLGASAESLYLGERAAEGRVRTLDLSDYRVLAFATHGLVAGNLSGLAEPALVLTPPREGTAQDDGLLTASEIAQLELDADWVILSACNTAAADGSPGAEGLSGLAKAFFYAGSRALLVSHWPVFSDPAVKLTTGMFEETAADPSLGGAEALRRSMLALMDDTESPHYAHPMFWAPFIVVGEGGVPGGS